MGGGGHSMKMGSFKGLEHRFFVSESREVILVANLSRENTIALANQKSGIQRKKKLFNYSDSILTTCSVLIDKHNKM